MSLSLQVSPIFDIYLSTTSCLTVYGEYVGLYLANLFLRHSLPGSPFSEILNPLLEVLLNISITCLYLIKKYLGLWYMYTMSVESPYILLSNGILPLAYVFNLMEVQDQKFLRAL